tara:strand:+ start:3965 stop:4861 length:897 start_codon:yes stop_codon:yes gene_type:complete
MKDVVLITGANGHLAKVVTQNLSKDHKVIHLTTRKTLTNTDSCFYWDIKKRYLDPKALKNCKHIIHLAGFSILKKWTRKNKQIMYDSRVESTKIILDTCKKLNVKPQTFICASAVGIYDNLLNDYVHEESKKGEDWIAKMVFDWEDAASQFRTIGSRVVNMRISLIFSENAGFLKYNLLSMKFGIGAIIGDKNRKINWIHANDISRFIQESIIDNNFSGPYNLACDYKKNQEQFIKEIKKYYFPYAIIIYVPMFLMKLFLGERSQIIETNIVLDTNKLKNQGFKCEINNLEQIFKTKK